ncbi:MAG: prenyltransferase [Candidatus Omnitrophica bacterium]|nr:prenyltransferase [Candidatus Omnitrophota bacterium]
MKNNLHIYIRALRLPFLTASVLPFILGTLIAKDDLLWLRFLMGLVSVVFTHIGANLMNDYADSKSGADWQDTHFFGFFGGSKLIQEGVLSQKFYLQLSLFSFFIAFSAVIGLCFAMGTLAVLGYYFLILFLGFSYSHKPLQLLYHRLGELIIFMLFGPALVMGAYYIQTGIFPGLKPFFLSLPAGFFTTAILFANEVPDFFDDIKSGKNTLISIIGPEKSYIFYFILEITGLAFILINLARGYLSWISAGALGLLFIVIKATFILKKEYLNKEKLVASSKLTIHIQTAACIIMIAGILL